MRTLAHRGPRPGPRQLLKGPWPWIAGGVCGLAAASLALPSVPTTDAWGWILWGRELSGGELHTDIGGSPSWKPLPVMFTFVLSLLGKSAPEGWLFVARALGLLGLVLAYLVGKRIAGQGAGIVAAAALALASGWVRGLEHGYTEPLVVSALLGAMLAYLEDRRRIAFCLVGAASLARPEFWALLVLAAVWLGRADRRARAPAWTVVAAVPVLWIGVDWLSSGRFDNGGKTAAGVARHVSGFDQLAVGIATPVVPVLVLAAVAAVFAAVRRERLVGLLVGAVLAGAVGLALGVAVGYPPSDRLMFPLMAGVCVLAGVGAERLVTLAGSRALRALIAVVLVAASVPFVVARAGDVSETVRAAEWRARLQLDLRHAARLARAKEPGARVAGLPYELIWLRGAVAWEWHVPLKEVGELHHPPRASRVYTFLPLPWPHAGVGATIVETRRWRVLAKQTFAPGPGG